VRGFADDLFRIATDRSEEIDKKSKRTPSTGEWNAWLLSIGISRAGVAEFLGFADTPKPVVINEALEIARKFSSQNP